MNETGRKQGSLCCIDRKVIMQTQPSINLHRAPRGHSVLRFRRPTATGCTKYCTNQSWPLGAKQALIFDGDILEIGIETGITGIEADGGGPNASEWQSERNQKSGKSRHSNSQ